MNEHAAESWEVWGRAMLSSIEGYLDLFDKMASGIEVEHGELARARAVMRDAIKDAAAAVKATGQDA